MTPPIESEASFEIFHPTCSFEQQALTVSVVSGENTYRSYYKRESSFQSLFLSTQYCYDDDVRYNDDDDDGDL